MDAMNEKDKLRGAFLGLAVGDALGTTLEFKDPGSFRPITDMVGGGPFNLKVGEWTDDTSMALCLAESILSKAGNDLEDQLKRYKGWWLNGYNSVTWECFDIGNTVRSALEQFDYYGGIYAGSKDPRSAGNGSIMRLAPVPLYYRKWDLEEVLFQCEESSRTTHQASECLIACRLLGFLIVRAISAQSKAELLELTEEQLKTIDPENLAPKIQEVARGSFKILNPPDIQGSGYVVKSIEAALWAFWNTETFEEGALKAVNLGDDADTIGAIYGQIAGAFYGMSGIPEHWLSKLAWKKDIQNLADKLSEK